MESFTLLGIKVHSLTVLELHQKISEAILNNKKLLVFNVNINAYYISKRDKIFNQILNWSDIIFCDGLGVILGARMLGHHIAERITYAEWFPRLSAMSEQKGYKLFLLGGRPGIAEQAAGKLVEKYPQLKIVGVHHGYFNKTGKENEKIIGEINRSQPNILLVCFGMPHQEKWIWENRERLDAQVYLDGGACLDFVSMKVKRAPRWIIRIGLEWLYRLMHEPRRLWRRYLIGNAWFFFSILKAKILEGQTKGDN